MCSPSMPSESSPTVRVRAQKAHVRYTGLGGRENSIMVLIDPKTGEVLQGQKNIPKSATITPSQEFIWLNVPDPNAAKPSPSPKPAPSPAEATPEPTRGTLPPPPPQTASGLTVGGAARPGPTAQARTGRQSLVIAINPTGGPSTGAGLQIPV